MRPLPPVTPLPLQPGPPFPRVRRDDPLSIHIRDKSDPHHVRDRLVDINVLRKNEDGTYSPYLPAKADLVDGKVPESQLPADKQGVTEVLVNGVSVVTGGTASIDLTGKVDKEAGKGLSSNDYTTEEKTKLENVEAGAQKNAIQTVKVNGTALTPDAQKAVNIPAASTVERGVVKLNNSINSTATTEAATPSAVRLAYNLASGASSKADQVDAEASKLAGDNTFTGENAFASKPRVNNPGRVMLMLKAQDSGYYNGPVDFVFLGPVTATFEFWDEDTQETKYKTVADVFSDYVSDLLDTGWTVYDVSVDAQVVQSWQCQLYAYQYNESTGDSDHVFWRDASIDSVYFHVEPVRDYNAERTRLACTLICDVNDANTGEGIGSVHYAFDPSSGTGSMSQDGSSIVVELSTLYAEFYDPDTQESVDVDWYTAFPYYVGASTDPNSSYYDYGYETDPEHYGWTPASDSELATVADISSLPASALPDLPASKITSGTFSTDRIPGLAASKIASGTLALARLPWAKDNDTSTLNGGVVRGDFWSAVAIRASDHCPYLRRVESYSASQNVTHQWSGRVLEAHGSAQFGIGTSGDGSWFWLLVNGYTGSRTLKSMLGLTYIGDSNIVANVDFNSAPVNGMYFVAVSVPGTTGPLSFIFRISNPSA